MKESDANIYGICEDDIEISPKAKEVFNRELQKLDDEMFIVAASWGWSKRRRMEFLDQDVKNYRLRRGVFRMCNPFFFTNKKTARYVIKKFEDMKIDVPCDSWLHGCLKNSSPEISRMANIPMFS